MPDSAEGSKGRTLTILVTAARWLLAVALAFGALSFLVHGRGVFARFGRPGGARIALAGAEFVGAGFFLFRPTALAGALVLLIVLAWAAGFPFAVGLGSTKLWLYLAAVLALSAATWVKSFRRPA